MKYFTTIVLAFALLFGMAQAQTIEVEKNQAVFGGAKYLNDAAGKKTLSFSGGYAFKIGPLWSYNTVEIGAERYGAVSTEIGFPISIMATPSGFTLSGVLLAGPNADWVGVSDSLGYINYLVGAAGGLLNGEWPNGVGISLGGKYKFRFEEETLYQDGFVFGLNLFKRF
jgi:hypothetical protein